MDEIEIRVKAAEIAMNFSARVTVAYVNQGIKLTEISPLAFAKDVENYIRTGKLPDPIKVKMTDIS